MCLISIAKYALVMAVFLPALAQYIHGTEPSTTNRFFSLNLKSQVEESDTIAIVRLIKVQPLYEVFTKDFYRIEVIESIAGELSPKSYLMVFTNIESFDGIPVKIENDMRYLIFLQNADFEQNDTLEDATGYTLTRQWKSLLALSPDAREKRFHRFLKRFYDIDTDAIDLVVNAVKAYVRDLKNEKKSDNDSELDSEEVQKIRQKLDLIE